MGCDAPTRMGAVWCSSSAGTPRSGRLREWSPPAVPRGTLAAMRAKRSSETSGGISMCSFWAFAFLRWRPSSPESRDDRSDPPMLPDAVALRRGSSASPSLRARRAFFFRFLPGSSRSMLSCAGGGVSFRRARAGGGGRT